MADTVLFEHDALIMKQLDEGFVEIQFDLKGESVNKFNRLTVEGLGKAVDQLMGLKEVKGLLITSAKDVFIVGADVTEFLDYFKEADTVLTEWLNKTHTIFNKIEDLPYASVVAINGIALGGGFEVCLAATYRVASTQAVVGLPETKLGIFPGWGGTIRLPRLMGADNAIEWIAGAKQYKAKEALATQAVDAVVEPERLRDAGLHLLCRAQQGELDYRVRQSEKKSPLTLRSVIESTMVFEGGKGFVAAQAGRHYPAPVTAIEVMQKGASLSRDEAIPIEVAGFVKMAKTPVAESLVSIFLADQWAKKKTKSYAKEVKTPVKRAAVLGAGIMGGGIAYQSASKGVPILMKDIQEGALKAGMEHAASLFTKLVERKKIKVADMAKGIGAITPTLSYGDMGGCDLIVEAVVENEQIKKKVLAELEDQVSADTILTTNTSTISVTALSEGLKRPENFCGLHFFNPVHRMPLIEVIRGAKTSEATIAKAVAYSAALGKTPIVVNDCAGFLVNRILFPYFAGLTQLLADGVDYQRIDKVMEGYGWPMGPCYLLDVVGIDTAVHAAAVMEQAFPDRMSFSAPNAMSLLKEAERFGQKNKKGFYLYELDRKGKLKKTPDPELSAILKPSVTKQMNEAVSDDDIVARMMVPMTNEALRCLEEKIVDTPQEVDLGLIYGLGFPPFRGGVLKELDRQGMGAFIAQCESFQELGALYAPAPLAKTLQSSGKTLY